MTQTESDLCQILSLFCDPHTADSVRSIIESRDLLLAHVETTPSGIHPPNPNDEGRSCLCSQCEFRRNAFIVAEAARKQRDGHTLMRQPARPLAIA